MKISPRRDLLEIWRGVASKSYQDGKWVWGGRFGSNSVSDAQQLLCLMVPATEIASLELADPDRTEEAALQALDHRQKRHRYTEQAHNLATIDEAVNMN